jgi:hypothetical protein
LCITDCEVVDWNILEEYYHKNPHKMKPFVLINVSDSSGDLNYPDVPGILVSVSKLKMEPISGSYTRSKAQIQREAQVSNI